MLKRFAGPLVTALILGGVALILFFNLNSNPTASSTGPKPEAKAENTAEPAGSPEGAKPAGFREFPIGEPVVENHMKIVAVWLPPIQMGGQGAMTPDLIHMEADIHATEENPNGLGLGEFVPYLKIHYAITPKDGGAPIQKGEFVPMVARDGLHYGASISMPKAGSFRLTYDIDHATKGGIGRHSDPATGVAPWWEPFQVSFDWDYAGPVK
ncbi:iron transporter [Singulisphaera rosea]